MNNSMALKKLLDALEQRKSREICWAYKRPCSQGFRKTKEELHC